MLRKALQLLVALLFYSTTLYAQNHWSLVGSPLQCRQPATLTAGHISSGGYQENNSRTYVLAADGIYYSTDQGESWHFSDDISAEVIKARKDDASEAWCGDIGVGPYLTINGGTTWNLKTDGLDNLNVRALAINPEDPDNVLAGCNWSLTNSCLYSWDSDNQEWMDVEGDLSFFVLSVNDLEIGQVENTLYYWAAISAGTYAGVYYSTNQGQNWSQLPMPPNLNLTNVTDIGGWPDRSAVGFLLH
jgi:hypothetical protein